MQIKKNTAIMIGLQAAAKLALGAGISGAGFSEMASVAFSRALRDGGDKDCYACQGLGMVSDPTVDGHMEKCAVCDGSGLDSDEESGAE